MKRSEVIDKLREFDWEETITGPGEFDLAPSSEGDRLRYGNFPMADGSLDSAAYWGGVPAKFLLKCPTTLQVEILSHFFGRLDDLPIAAVRDGEIVQFIDPRVDICPSHQIIEIVNRAIPNANFDRMMHSSGWIDLYTSGERAQDVSVGDAVAFGVYVGFSPFGSNNPEVSAYLKRLVCSNGMTRNESLVRFSRGRYGRNLLGFFSETIPMAFSACELEMERLRRLREAELNGNRESAIAHVLATVPASVRDFVRGELSIMEINTMYDLVCGVHEIATHRLSNPNIVRQMYNSAGQIESHVRECPTCHRVFNDE